MEILKAENPSGNPIKVAYAIYPSLLDAYVRYKKADDDETFDALMDRLNKVKQDPTEDQKKGIRFEADINQVIRGGEQDCDNWTPVHQEITDVLKNCSDVQKYIEVVIKTRVGLIKLYGIVDFMFDKMIVDLKRTGNYKLGKYKESAQHPMYSLICSLNGTPIEQFKYIVADDKNAYYESYVPNDNMYVKLIYLIYEFIDFIEYYKPNIKDKTVFGG